MRATLFSLLALAVVASANRVVPGAGDALNKAAPAAQASSSTCTKRTRTVTAKRAATIVAEPSAVRPDVALGAEIVDTTSSKLQAMNTKKPIKANGKGSKSTTSTTAVAAAQTTAVAGTDAASIGESSTLGTSTRRGRGQITAKTKPAKTTANAAGTAVPSADTSSVAAISTTAVAANSDTKTKTTRVRNGKGKAGASSAAAVDSSSAAAASTTASAAGNTKTKTKPTKAATAKAGSSSISTAATAAVTGGAGGIPTTNPTTPVPVSRTGGNLQPSAAAEAHKRDATATRAFSRVEIRAPNGQCLSVDPTAGDFRQNLIPVALVDCSGTPNEKWDIVTAGKHNKAGKTPSTLVVSALTQGCISFDGRRQAGDTVTLFSCGGRADGSGETNADQLFPYIGQLSFAMAPTGQGSKTCVLPGGDGGRLESGPCPKDGSQLFSIFP